MTKDQKTALGIGAAGIGGFAFWRMRSGKSTRTTGHGPPPLTNAAVGGSIAPYTPQAPVIVAPGESVYDPNTTGLLNTPTSPLLQTGTGTFGPGGEQVLQSHAPSQPAYVVNVKYPTGVHTRRRTRQPAKRHRHKKHKAAATHG